MDLTNTSAISVVPFHNKNTEPHSFTTANKLSTLVGANGKLARLSGSMKLNTPIGICFNPSDNHMYVCDSHKHVVRKVSLKGKVETFVKDIIYASYIATYHKENAIFVLQLYKNIVTKVSAKGEVKVFAKIARPGVDPVFSYPSGLAIDQQTGCLFFSEFWSHTIHMISPQGEVTHLAGRTGESGFADGKSAEAKFNLPGGLWFDQQSNSLLVCDCNNDRIRRITLKEGEATISTVCRVKDPSCVVATESGTILVGTPACIYKLTAQISGAFEAAVLVGESREKSSEKQSNFAGFGKPLGITVHESSHTCFMSESGSSTIRKLTFIND